LNYFVSDYFGFVLYCGYLVSWGIVAVDARFFKLGKGASLLLGYVSIWVAWVDFCFWIIYVLVQGLEIFEFGAMAILYSIMCYGVEIINFLEFNSLLTLDRLLINLFYFWEGCLVFFWVSLWIPWVLRIFVGFEFRYFWFCFGVLCLLSVSGLMISNVTISLLLGFANCVSSSKFVKWTILVCAKNAAIR